jgi:membrane protein
MWARIWIFLDGCFFGPASTRTGTFGLVLRILRYPYAVIRELWHGDITLRAMGLVYTSLLSVIPVVAFAFVILKIVGSRHDLEPIVYEFFRPVGGNAAHELASRVVQFAHRVSGGVVGSLGVAVLAWTLFGTIKKVEDSFNFVWRVDRPRSLARRIAQYLILVVVGPLLLIGFIGLSHAALDTAAVQEVAKWGLLRHTIIAIVPYAMVTAFFMGMYMLIPNTRVYWRPALIGAVVGGVLWAAVGKMFTAFVVYSTRLQIVYAGFAFIVTALLWTYFGWLILLAGAQLSFYIQNPTYLRFGLRELRLSNVEIERLALKLMYFVGRTHVSDDEHWRVNRLAAELGLPGIAVMHMVAAFEQAGLLIVTKDNELILARDIGRITVCEILDVARNQRSGYVEPRNTMILPISSLIAAIGEAYRNCCGNLTLRDLVEEAPRPPLTLASRRN